MTCSACAFQKNQVLFQIRIRSLNSARLFTLKQLYQCHPSALDTLTGLSCLLLRLNCPENKEIKNYVLCWQNQELLTPDAPFYPLVLNLFVHSKKLQSHQYFPHNTCASDPNTLTAMQPTALWVIVELCSKLSRKCFLLTTPRDKPVACAGRSVPSVLSVRGKWKKTWGCVSQTTRPLAMQQHYCGSLH